MEMNEGNVEISVNVNEIDKYRSIVPMQSSLQQRKSSEVVPWEI